MTEPTIVRPPGATRRVPAPPAWGEDPLSLFMEAAQHNEMVGFVAMQHGRFRQLAFVDGILEELAQGLDEEHAPDARLFVLRAHSIYRAACRLAVSGQTTESTIVSRGVLEIAVYLFHLSRSAEAKELWLARYDSDEAMERVKKHLTTRAFLEELTNADPALGEHVKGLYEQAIDYGAQPNPFAVYAGVELDLSTISGASASESFTFFETDPKARDAGARLVLEAGVTGLEVFKLLVPKAFEARGLVTPLGAITGELASEHSQHLPD
jgi:hypothetical protein